MTWRDLISSIYAVRKHEPGIATKCVFQPPALIQEINYLESELKVKLSKELQSALLETNGVMELMRIDHRDWFENIWLLWPIERIITGNLIYRRDSANGAYDGPFQDLVVFSNAGTDGILFAHTVVNGIAEPNVVAWFPAEVEMRQIAPSLREFLEGWLMERIML